MAALSRGEKVAKWSRTGPGRSHHWPWAGVKGSPASRARSKKPGSAATRSTSSASRSGSRATWDSFASEEAPRLAAIVDGGWETLANTIEADDLTLYLVLKIFV